MARLAKGNAVTMQRTVVVEQAHAKVNLVLRVGPPRADGLHPLCSLFAALELADEVTVGLGAAATDEVLCPGVEGDNLAARAVAAFLAAGHDVRLTPRRIEIIQGLQVASALGGGRA